MKTTPGSATDSAPSPTDAADLVNKGAYIITKTLSLSLFFFLGGGGFIKTMV